MEADIVWPGDTANYQAGIAFVGRGDNVIIVPTTS